MWKPLLPLLLATPSPPSSILSPAAQLIGSIRNLYSDLNTRTISKSYRPTVHFNFVSPPVNDSSTWQDHHVHPELLPYTSSSQTNNDEGGDSDDDEKSFQLFEKVASTHGSTKPLALYIPGLDGMGISATRQYDDLSTQFEFWRMTVSKNDKSSFASLTEDVASFIHDAAIRLNRDVVLIGESFGGVLAPSAVMRVNAIVNRLATTTRTNGGVTNANKNGARSPIKGLVLVNPATSFFDTNWETFGPLVSTLRHLETAEQEEEEDMSNTDNRRRRRRKLPSPYSIMGGLTLATLIPDWNQFQRIVSTLLDIPVRNTDDINEILIAMRDGFGILAGELPAETVEHRITQWLPVGAAVVNPRLSTIDIPTLVIAGQDDNMLPTKEEGERLVKIIPNCTKIDVPGSGHFVLDERFNLTKAIIDSPINPLNKVPEKPKDPITDWKLPDRHVIRSTIDSRVKPLRDLTSPVFVSTDKQGRRRMGLSQIPRAEDGPMVFVANHQFGGLDLGMIVAQLLEDRNIAARGLGHPILFQNGGVNGGNNALNGGPPVQGGQQGDANPFSASLFQQFGAVMVNPKNYYRLMETGQVALLFPGGVREVFHGKDEAYRLFWPEKVDFVRIAAKFNATVVPLSAVGAADSVNILIDGPDILKLPFGIGDRAKDASASVISARFDSDNDSELFQPPFALPKPLPARHYFIFGKPMSTAHLDHKDKVACEKFYEDVKQEMQRGFDDVFRAREKDPFANTAQRIAYERLTGKKAPTFSISDVH